METTNLRQDKEGDDPTRTYDVFDDCNYNNDRTTDADGAKKATVIHSSAAYIEQDIICKQRKEIMLLMEELGTRDEELNDLVRSHRAQVKAWEADRNKLRSLQHRLKEYENDLKKSDHQLQVTLGEMRKVSDQKQLEGMELKKTKDEMDKLSQKIKENSYYLKEMETQNKSLLQSVKNLLSVKEDLENKGKDLTSQLKSKSGEINVQASELSRLSRELQILKSRNEEGEETIRNLKAEASAWKKRYCMARDDSDKLTQEKEEKDEHIRSLTVQLHETAQQTLALQKALFTSCEREKCKEEVLNSLRKQQKRSMQEMSSLRELYERQTKDLTVYHLSVLGRGDRQEEQGESGGHKRTRLTNKKTRNRQQVQQPHKENVEENEKQNGKSDVNMSHNKPNLRKNGPGNQSSSKFLIKKKYRPHDVLNSDLSSDFEKEREVQKESLSIPLLSSANRDGDISSSWTEVAIDGWNDEEDDFRADSDHSWSPCERKKKIDLQHVKKANKEVVDKDTKDRADVTWILSEGENRVNTQHPGLPGAKRAWSVGGVSHRVSSPGSGDLQPEPCLTLRSLTPRFEDRGTSPIKDGMGITATATTTTTATSPGKLIHGTATTNSPKCSLGKNTTHPDRLSLTRKTTKEGKGEGQEKVTAWGPLAVQETSRRPCPKPGGHNETSGVYLSSSDCTTMSNAEQEKLYDELSPADSDGMCRELTGDSKNKFSPSASCHGSKPPSTRIHLKFSPTPSSVCERSTAVLDRTRKLFSSKAASAQQSLATSQASSEKSGLGRHDPHSSKGKFFHKRSHSCHHDTKIKSEKDAPTCSKGFCLSPAIEHFRSKNDNKSRVKESSYPPSSEHLSALLAGKASIQDDQTDSCEDVESLNTSESADVSKELRKCHGSDTYSLKEEPLSMQSFNKARYRILAESHNLRSSKEVKRGTANGRLVRIVSPKNSNLPLPMQAADSCKNCNFSDVTGPDVKTSDSSGLFIPHHSRAEPCVRIVSQSSSQDSWHDEDKVDRGDKVIKDFTHDQTSQRDYFYEETVSLVSEHESPQKSNLSHGNRREDSVYIVSLPSTSKPFMSTKAPSLYKHLSSVHFSEKTGRFELKNPDTGEDIGAREGSVTENKKSLIGVRKDKNGNHSNNNIKNSDNSNNNDKSNSSSNADNNSNTNNNNQSLEFHGNVDFLDHVCFIGSEEMCVACEGSQESDGNPLRTELRCEQPMASHHIGFRLPSNTKEVEEKEYFDSFLQSVNSFNADQNPAINMDKFHHHFNNIVRKLNFSNTSNEDDNTVEQSRLSDCEIQRLPCGTVFAPPKYFKVTQEIEHKPIEVPSSNQMGSFRVEKICEFENTAARKPFCKEISYKTVTDDSDVPSYSYECPQKLILPFQFPLLAEDHNFFPLEKTRKNDACLVIASDKYAKEEPNGSSGVLELVSGGQPGWNICLEDSLNDDGPGSSKLPAMTSTGDNKSGGQRVVLSSCGGCGKEEKVVMDDDALVSLPDYFPDISSVVADDSQSVREGEEEEEEAPHVQQADGHDNFVEEEVCRDSLDLQFYSPTSKPLSHTSTPTKSHSHEHSSTAKPYSRTSTPTAKPHSRTSTPSKPHSPVVFTSTSYHDDHKLSSMVRPRTTSTAPSKHSDHNVSSLIFKPDCQNMSTPTSSKDDCKSTPNSNKHSHTASTSTHTVSRTPTLDASSHNTPIPTTQPDCLITGCLNDLNSPAGKKHLSQKEERSNNTLSTEESNLSIAKEIWDNKIRDELTSEINSMLDGILCQKAAWRQMVNVENDSNNSNLYQDKYCVKESLKKEISVDSSDNFVPSEKLKRWHQLLYEVRTDSYVVIPSSLRSSEDTMKDINLLPCEDLDESHKMSQALPSSHSDCTDADVSGRTSPFQRPQGELDVQPSLVDHSPKDRVVASVPISPASKLHRLLVESQEMIRSLELS